MSTQIGDQLFRLRPDQWPAAFLSLPPGALWASLLPGADPKATMGLLGDRAVALFRASLDVMPQAELDSAVAAAGSPFGPEPPAWAILEALMAWLRRDTQACDIDSVHVTATVRHRCRSRWASDVAACVDYTGHALMHGYEVDPISALVACPSADIRAAVRLADGNTRMRVAHAAEACREDPGAFRLHYLRRSAIGGLLHQVSAFLSSPADGITVCDEMGWPILWEPPVGGSKIPFQILLVAQSAGSRM